MAIKNIDRKGCLIILFLFIIILIIYADALRNEFVSDDHDIVVNYPLIRDVKNIPKFFVVQDTFQSGDPTGYYRPLARMSYLIDYHLWGLNPFGYHLNNILLHAAAAIVFFLAAKMLFSMRIAFLSALFFAIHPVHVEAVTWITGRNNILAGLFIMLSFYFYIRFDKKAKHEGRIGDYLLALFFLILALLSKEFALVFPLLLFLYHLSYKEESEISMRRFSLKKGITAIPFIVLIGLYLYTRYLIVGPSHGLSLSSLSYNLLLSLKIFFTYIHILVFPVGLKMTYFIPTLERFFNTRGILAIITLSLAIVITIISFRKDKRLFFAIVFFFIFLFPVSGIVVFSPVPVAERYTYVASMGFCLIYGILADRYILKRSSCIKTQMAMKIIPLNPPLEKGGKGDYHVKYRMFTLILILVISLFYIFQTIQRNRDWKDDLTLALSTVREIPSSPVAFYYLGNAYRMKGDVEEAVKAFERSILLSPGFPHSHLALAMIYHERNMWDEAIKEYKEALMLKPDDTDAHSNLAFVYFQKGMIDEAIVELKEVIRINPEDANAQSNLKNLCEEKELRKRLKKINRR